MKTVSPIRNARGRYASGSRGSGLSGVLCLALRLNRRTLMKYNSPRFILTLPDGRTKCIGSLRYANSPGSISDQNDILTDSPRLDMVYLDLKVSFLRQ